MVSYSVGHLASNLMLANKKVPTIAAIGLHNKSPDSSAGLPLQAFPLKLTE